MNLHVHNSPIQNHQQTAQTLLDHSYVLKQIFQDQWFYLWSLTPQNLFKADPEHHQLLIADGLIQVQFHDGSNVVDHLQAISTPFIQFHSSNPNIKVQKIADFIFNEIDFWINALQAHHPLFLKSKMQLFRQLLVEEVFEWVDGENRLEQYLYNLNEEEAQQLDSIMIEAGYYKLQHLTEFATLGTAIPLQVELNFKHLSLVNSILGENFLNVQKLIPVYDRLCFSAAEFIPEYLYRMIETNFENQFTLAQVQQYQDDFKLLIHHAMQQPNILGFSHWIKRDFWNQSDIFAKKYFSQAGVGYWDERISKKFPLFYLSRTVNWLFKQDALVVDWIASQIEDVNLRIAVTALSFTDTSKIHPQVILETLNYFKSITGRIFIQECLYFSKQQHWFDLNQSDDQVSLLFYQHHYLLKQKDQKNLSERHHRTVISDSILYLEEWLDLLSLVSKKDLGIAKQVFNRIYRVMQAYMLFLQKTIEDLPEPLIPYMRTELQQDSKFHHLLHQHQISADEFRKKFKHPAIQFNRVTNIFDSYVADYLVDYFYSYQKIAKNVTWQGLYQQSVHWHQQIDFNHTLLALRERVHQDHWRRVSPQEIMFTEHWKFTELYSLDQIIQESVSYKHCLALSYSQRIIDGEYVAFHMCNLADENLHLTLGCVFKFEQLYFDQLRLPNNEQADGSIQNDAVEFIQKVNQHLIWDFKEPKVQ